MGHLPSGSPRRAACMRAESSKSGTIHRVIRDSAHAPGSDESSTATRADALASRQRILEAAASLVVDRRVTMAEIAAAAGVGRSTLYRHFPTRQALERALDANEPFAEPPADLARVATLPFRAPGQLGRE